MVCVLKYLLIGLVAVNAVYSYTEVQDENHKLQGLIDDIINGTLNNIIGTITDPLTVSGINLNMTDASLIGHLDIPNLTLHGLNGLVATAINTNIFTLSTSIQLELSAVALNVSYDTDLLLLKLLPLYALGSMSAKLDNITISINGSVGLDNGLSLNNVAIALGLDSGVFEITGLLNNVELSEIFTDVLNDNLALFLNTYKDQISRIISPIAQTIINAILHGNKAEIEKMIKDSKINDAL